MKNLFLIVIGFTSIILQSKAQNSFTDSRDGNVYNYVTIGTQIWMAENLKYLPDVVGPNTFSNTIPYYYVYGYNGTDVVEAKASANYSTYGVLYNWSAAMSGAASSDLNPSGVQGICPDGWHLPSDFEWLYLAFYLVGDSVAGGKLKEAGTLHWDSPNTNATNETGFTALPGGFCDNVGSFYDIRRNSIWWSSTEFNSTRAIYRNILYSYADLFKYNVNKDRGHSVRCVKNGNNSIDNIDNKTEIFVYPNPANEFITIYTPFFKDAQLSIFDMNGNSLYSTYLNDSSNELNISFLKNGIYLIRINDNNQWVQTKFVVSK